MTYKGEQIIMTTPSRDPVLTPLKSTATLSNYQQ